MIANISPSTITFDDTYNTLKYANRAKNIKTNVVRNVVSVQYHISNYNNIISNLKSEITDLKVVLNKRDLNENKSQQIFEKLVEELDQHFEDEFMLKKSIISTEQDINLIKLSINTKNIEHEEKEISHNITSSKDENINLSNINIDDNRNILFTNIIDNAREKESKLVSLKNSIERKTNKLKLLFKRREEILSCIKEKCNSNELYLNYLDYKTKTQNSKIYILDNQNKEKYTNTFLEGKENYIQELENQLLLRDEILKNKNMTNHYGLKELTEIKNEYNYNLPIIYTKELKNINSNINLISSSINNNLPPIKSHHINNLLNEVKLASNNISKLDFSNKNNVKGI